MLIMPSDDTFILWTPCPECNGVGDLDASEEGEPPWTVVVSCWRCEGDGGWLDEDADVYAVGDEPDGGDGG